MLPIDSEFIVLYLLYTIFGVFLFVKMLCFKTSFYKLNLILFLAYTAIMVYIFVDEENFKYGNSLGVLFYSFLFILIHILLFGILKSSVITKQKD